MPSLLSLTDLAISVDSQPIVRGIDLDVQPGEIHAIMGPNGSGKSTLVSALMGHPKYQVTSGKALFQGKDLLSLAPNERSLLGLFLAFQYPKEIAGVTLRSFLFAAAKAHSGAKTKMSPLQFKKILDAEMKALHIDPALAERSLNHGFSGGEKKKAEILQLKILKPTLALLDETDSGLDVDALRTVAEGVDGMRSKNFSAIIVTHYARILDYITPDHVHVMIAGKIVKSGGAELAKQLEKEGYGEYAEGSGKIRLS